MGIFLTTLSGEYFLASKYFGLSKESLFDLAVKSIDYVFQPQSFKACLKAKFLSYREQLLISY
jgi:hypothetical protein